MRAKTKQCKRTCRCQAKLVDTLKPIPKLGVEIEAMPSRHQSITARGIRSTNPCVMHLPMPPIACHSPHGTPRKGNIPRRRCFDGQLSLVGPQKSAISLLGRALPRHSASQRGRNIDNMPWYMLASGGDRPGLAPIDTDRAARVPRFTHNGASTLWQRESLVAIGETSHGRRH
ncbi:hypothetical protein BGZ61DRAFT_200870 [Ilyonectria robusta]|uniref:uncharacterized protein n=1 Tax=Ilyonectria robusta TaxID=1079257 RepID=UPI001E8DE450|nr:uncharacterized protein BGZ61DRAFT_200870 [Ilyonectria robusta]KAH8722163.1 hypothetical protein BGZ61DRAFT_200870 [Ilyonectria robusta]